jgi:chemotaxis family two-component system response regulator Rcp1
MAEALHLPPARTGGRRFTILVVDDDEAGTVLIQELMKDLGLQHELHFARDGLEALEYLARRGKFAGAPRPNLILLDINLPRLGGLETLAAIKYNPDLFAIPVIMLSSSASPDDVRDSYHSRANSYVKKPLDLEGSLKFVQAIGSFWMECGIQPEFHQWTSPSRQLKDSKRRSSRADRFRLHLDTGTDSGPDSGNDSGKDSDKDSGKQIAKESAEAGSSVTYHSTEAENATPNRKSGCEDHGRLLDEFGGAVRDLLALHEQQFEAIAEDDSECSRFDLLIHMANENKQRAKYAYLRHVEAHGCSTNNADQTRT